eukprot:11305281-Prorocentrum_lima.AAC.1
MYKPFCLKYGMVSHTGAPPSPPSLPLMARFTDAPTLVYSPHGEVLRLLSDATQVHYPGLQVAAARNRLQL